MRVTIVAVILTLTLIGCGKPDPIVQVINTIAAGQPNKATALKALHDEGIIKTSADVGTMTVILEASCPIFAIPGATQQSPLRVQQNFAQNWNLNMTLEQVQQFQVIQQDYCVVNVNQ